MPQPNLTPLDLSDKDLDRLSAPTEQDIVITNSFVTKVVDQLYKNLLLAESQELLEVAFHEGIDEQ
jgi:adenosine/AMP kinase